MVTLQRVSPTAAYVEDTEAEFRWALLEDCVFYARVVFGVEHPEHSEWMPYAYSMVPLPSGNFCEGRCDAEILDAYQLAVPRLDYAAWYEDELERLNR